MSEDFYEPLDLYELWYLDNDGIWRVSAYPHKVSKERGERLVGLFNSNVAQQTRHYELRQAPKKETSDR